ncbi:MAG: family ATPase, partial [Acidimicrobiales bacterium]|nr:family ATPase [Acidimicrobiales bacterium]
DPVPTLRAAAAAVADEAPELAADLLLEALAALVRRGAFAEIIAVTEETVCLIDHVDEHRALRITVAHGAVLLAQGNLAGGPMLDRYQELGRSDALGADAVFLAEIVAPSLTFMRRGSDAAALLDRLEGELRERAAVRPLISVLGARVMAHHGQRLPDAVAVGLEAISLAEETGMPLLASTAAASMAVSAAVAGDATSCRRAADLLLASPMVEHHASAWTGLGYLALVEGRLDDADQAYRALAEVSPVGAMIVRWEPEWIEVMIRSGRTDEARALLDELVALGPPGPASLGAVARVRGMLAPDEDDAAGHLGTALAVFQASGNKVGEGRTELVWGERLRRARRRAEARGHLARAVELLEGVGAALLAARATTELRAAGGVVDEAEPAHVSLTPHELAIARLVVGGASNRDVGARLFISPRTVEAHLSAIFRKLGVRNRRQLAARALDEAVLQPTT